MLCCALRDGRFPNAIRSVRSLEETDKKANGGAGRADWVGGLDAKGVWCQEWEKEINERVEGLYGV